MRLAVVAVGTALASAGLLVAGSQSGWAQRAEPSQAAGHAFAAASRAAGVTSRCCTVVVNGPAVTMKVTRPGTTATRTFRGKAGQRIGTVLTNVVVTGGNSNCATLTLLNPSHGTVDSSQMCGFSRIGFPGPDVLTVSGTYTVRLKLDPTATGSAKLWVSAPITLGTVKVNRPAAKMPVMRVGQGVQRTFTGKAGQRISTVITNLLVTGGNSNCATLTLLNPGHGMVGSKQACGFSSIGIGPHKLTVSGTYTVRLELEPTATGGGRLIVST